VFGSSRVLCPPSAILDTDAATPKHSPGLFPGNISTVQYFRQRSLLALPSLSVVTYLFHSSDFYAQILFFTLFGSPLALCCLTQSRSLPWRFALSCDSELRYPWPRSFWSASPSPSGAPAPASMMKIRRLRFSLYLERSPLSVTPNLLSISAKAAIQRS
jgi:hypothetical protein